MATRPPPRGLAAHKNWKIRAEDYRQLAGETKDPELHRVLDHLTDVCREMSKATSPKPSVASSWMHHNEMVREESAERWRIREAEYRAIADNCATAEGKQSWLVLADRCKTLAYYLSAIGKPHLAWS
jgi:hypothetical protein